MSAMPMVHRALRWFTVAVIVLGWAIRVLFLLTAATTVGEMHGWAWIGALGVHLLVTAVASPTQVLLALVLPWTAGAAARADARLAEWGEEGSAPPAGWVAFDGIAAWALIDALLTGLPTAFWWFFLLLPPG